MICLKCIIEVFFLTINKLDWSRFTMWLKLKRMYCIFFRDHRDLRHGLNVLLKCFLTIKKLARENDHDLQYGLNALSKL